MMKDKILDPKVVRVRCLSCKSPKFCLLPLRGRTARYRRRNLGNTEIGKKKFKILPLSLRRSP